MPFATKKLLSIATSFVGLVAIAAPLSAAAVTANTTISATLNPTITVTTSATVTLNLTPGVSAVESRASDTVTVNTNDTVGYTLKLSDADAVTNLVSGTNTIGAHAGTFAIPTALTNNKWGYALAGGTFSVSYAAISNETGSTDEWAGMPGVGSPQTIKTTATTATNDVTTVWYGIKVDSTQPSGVGGNVYTDQVTYTATAN